VRGRHDSLGGWKAAYRSLPVGDLPAWQEVIHSTWDLGRVLPWDHLEGPLPKATLAKHHQQAFEAMELGYGVDSQPSGA